MMPESKMHFDAASALWACSRCCRRRPAFSSEDSRDDVQAAVVSSVEVAAYELSQKGVYSSCAKTPSLTLVWDADRIGLHAGGTEVATLDWAHISAIWASVRTREYAGFYLDLALETKQGDLDFLCTRGPMNTAGGKLLEFLETQRVNKLKGNKAPRFAMSRYAAPLYSWGLSSNRVRVVLGWLEISAEVILAVGFLTQLQKIVLSRESKLWEASVEIVEDLGSLGSLTAIAMLVQHILVFIVVLRSLWATFAVALRSFHTFHRAGKKAHKSLQKLKSQRPPSAAVGVGGPGAAGANATSGDAATAARPSTVAGCEDREGELRRRKA